MGRGLKNRDADIADSGRCVYNKSMSNQSTYLSTESSQKSGLTLVFVILSVLSICFSVFCASAAEAQGGEVVLSRWAIEVWPEYDQPAVLVIQNGTVADGVSLPQTLRIPVPVGARVHAVAFPTEDGSLLSLPWSTEATADGQVVVFELANNDFVVEYYSDTISPPPNRSFELPLVTPYVAEQASVTLRQPAPRQRFPDQSGY